MSDIVQSLLRDQLVSRRGRLAAALTHPHATANLHSLLGEVDAALGRLERGDFGLCESCGDPIEPDRLIADPLLRFCLDHLTPDEQQALQRDLDLAARIQRGLLPAPSLELAGWQFAYEYHPAGIVSGDYCDVMPGPSGDTYFLLGDVAGKGVAASMLMTQLHGMFRSLVPMGLALAALVERASSIFCDSTLPSHYATLASVRASPTGDIEVCNAGHLPLMLVRPQGVTRIESNSLPIGMFCSARYETTLVRLAPGDVLVAFTDGLSEVEDADGGDLGLDRLEQQCAALGAEPPARVAAGLIAAARRFGGGAPQADDMTVLAIARA